MLVDLLFYAHTYGCICASMYVYVYVMLLLFFELLNLLICVLFICTLTIQNTTTKYKKKWVNEKSKLQQQNMKNT